MIRVLALLLAVLACSSASAEPAPLAGVGKLDLRGEAACTGTLIAPDLVLTAGHCLKASGDERRIAADEITFRPGRSAGVPHGEAIPGQSLAVHPIWGFGVGPRTVRVAFDLGLLRLAEPVPDTVARPLGFGALPDVDERLLIAGYAGGKGQTARQRRCSVIEANHAVAGLGCPVDFGESGSPMLRVEDGVPRIVGVLSNKGILDGQAVGFGPVTATGVDTVIVHLESLEALEDTPPPGLDAGN